VKRLLAPWMLLSLLTVVLWGAWGLQSKIITDRMSPLTGLLGGSGNVAFYLALAAGGKASIVVPFVGLAPLVTIVLALVILKESLTKAQVAGLGFALISIYLLSV
jgi:uncharacterized membrane protein